MSKFSELLSTIVEKNNVNKLQLSKKLQIDRSLLYKYLNGQTLPSNCFVEKISRELCLAPFLNKQLNEAYDITKDGEDIFQRRKIVKEIFSDIHCIQKKPTEYLDTSFNISLADKFENSPITTVTGSTDVNTILKFIVDHAIASEKESDIYIIMQPEFNFLLGLINTVPQNRRNKITFHHAIRFEDIKNGNTISAGIYNLETFSKILPLAYGCSNDTTPNRFYNPYYYYDSHAMQSQHIMEFMPYFVASNDYAISISNDCNNALFYSEPNVVNLLKNEFLTLKERMQPLIQKLDNLLDLALFYHNVEHEGNFVATLIRKDPCLFMSIPIRMYESKIKKDIPHREYLSKIMLERVDNLFRNLSHNGKYNEFIPINAFDYIIEKRCYCDISLDMVHALTDDEVVEVLTNYKNNFETQENFQVFMTDERFYNSKSDALIVFYANQFLHVGRYNDCGYPLEMIFIKEKSILDAFNDYLTNVIPKENGVITDKQTILNIMQKKIDDFKIKVDLV